MELRRALIDLGVGLWLNDPAAKVYGTTLRDRGKKGLVIACAMAHRANQIAFATGPRPERLRPDQMDPGGLTQSTSQHRSTVPGSRARRTRTRRRVALWQTLARRYAATSLAPGSFALAAARTKPDDPPTSEVAYVSVGARHPDSHHLPTEQTLEQLRAAESINHAHPRT